MSIGADDGAAAFVPQRVSEVELGRPLTGITARDPATGQVYERASVLVRVHGEPIGIVDLPLSEAGISAEDLARAIWTILGDGIERHLRADGIVLPSPLTGSDVPGDGSAPCRAELHAAVASTPASVVITTRDRTARLEASLATVFAMDHPGFDVVVVDNVPSDASTETMIRARYADRPLTYVREDRPGISAARNAGIRLAKGKVIAFTDDDVEVDRHWLTQLVAGFGSGDNVGVVTGLTLPAALNLPVHGWFEEYGGFDKGFEPRLVDLGSHRPQDDPLFPYAPGRLGSGNNMAFRADVLRAIGGFDPCLGVGSPTHSGEDLAAFIRTLWAGWQLAYSPAALIHHHHRDTYEALRRQVYGYGVGLTACMVSCLSRRPGKVADFVGRVPAGLGYLLSSSSTKNRRRTSDYPRRLAVDEMLGMAYGPFAYARARGLGTRQGRDR